jgi:hypothetical protein
MKVLEKSTHYWANLAKLYIAWFDQGIYQRSVKSHNNDKDLIKLKL